MTAGWAKLDTDGQTVQLSQTARGWFRLAPSTPTASRRPSPPLQPRPRRPRCMDASSSDPKADKRTPRLGSAALRRERITRQPPERRACFASRHAVGTHLDAGACPFADSQWSVRSMPIPLPNQPYPEPTPTDPNPAPVSPPAPPESPQPEPVGVPPTTPGDIPPPGEPLGVPPTSPPEIPVTPTTPQPTA
jgi:hypothetical protein